MTSDDIYNIPNVDDVSLKEYNSRLALIGTDRRPLTELTNIYIDLSVLMDHYIGAAIVALGKKYEDDHVKFKEKVRQLSYQICFSDTYQDRIYDCIEEHTEDIDITHEEVMKMMDLYPELVFHFSSYTTVCMLIDSIIRQYEPINSNRDDDSVYKDYIRLVVNTYDHRMPKYNLIEDNPHAVKLHGDILAKSTYTDKIVFINEKPSEHIKDHAKDYSTIIIYDQKELCISGMMEKEISVKSNNIDMDMLGLSHVYVYALKSIRDKSNVYNKEDMEKDFIMVSSYLNVFFDNFLFFKMKPIMV